MAGKNSEHTNLKRGHTINPLLSIPNVSVKVEITKVVGNRMEFEGALGIVNFDVKVRLNEKERKSQIVIVEFDLLMTSRPSIVRFDVEGLATLVGRDEDIRKMLEVDPETRLPSLFHRVYQSAFQAMYLMSSVLQVVPPPHDLLQLTSHTCDDKTKASTSQETAQQAEVNIGFEKSVSDTIEIKTESKPITSNV